MTLLATTQLDLLAAVGVGVAGVLVSSVVLVGLRAGQQRRVQSLAEASVNFERMAMAAKEAEFQQSKLIHDVLESAVADVASDQQLPDGLVTGAIFTQEADQSLRILEGQAINLEAPEFELRIRPGETGVGEAARTGSPVVAVFKSPLQESTIEDPEERARINPALRWIIAVPVVPEDHHALWVLSISGLVEPRTQEQLERSVGHLLYYREFLELLLKGIAGKE
jgi:hypothetical protein